MIYVLKFFASFILPPGLFLILLAILACKLYRQQRKAAICLGIITVCFYFLSTGYVGSLLLRSLEQRYQPPVSAVGDVIIMLGSGATLDTPDVDGMGNLSGSAANRLLTAARLQKKLNVPIVVSGGQVYEDSGREAVVARRVLLGLGVPDAQILVEDRSLNTQQNAQYVKGILMEQGFTQPILVTSAFHMERSVLNFARVGLTVMPYPSDYTVSNKQGTYLNQFTPSADGLRNSCIFFREWLGIWAMRVR